MLANVKYSSTFVSAKTKSAETLLKHFAQKYGILGKIAHILPFCFGL